MIDITIRSERLDRAIAALEGPGRAEMMERIGIAVHEGTIRHLAGIALDRHDTAARLGASPTGFYGRAAEGVDYETTGDGVDLHFNHPGLSRAFRDVEITPQESEALTIPVSALAYGKRAGEFARDALFVWRSKTTGNAFLALRQEDRGAPLQLMYLLAGAVLQRQDRTLLPSDDQYREWAIGAIVGYLEEL